MHKLKIETYNGHIAETRRGKEFSSNYFEYRRAGGVRAFINGKEIRQGSEAFAWACGSPGWCKNCGRLGRPQGSCKCGSDLRPARLKLD